MTTTAARNAGGYGLAGLSTRAYGHGTAGLTARRLKIRRTLASRRLARQATSPPSLELGGLVGVYDPTRVKRVSGGLVRALVPERLWLLAKSWLNGLGDLGLKAHLAPAVARRVVVARQRAQVSHARLPVLGLLN